MPDRQEARSAATADAALVRQAIGALYSAVLSGESISTKLVEVRDQSLAALDRLATEARRV